MKVRLQKYMADCGVASRRKCEEIINSGRVQVNNNIVNSVVLIDEGIDKVELDGIIIQPIDKKIYIIINKPTCVITSVHDQFDRKTVMDYIDLKERLFPVGRLDYDTSGMLIMTNDGRVSNNIMHPSKKIDKVYIAEICGIPSQEDINIFQQGIMIDESVTSPATLRIIDKDKEKSTVEVVIHEGKNRQVRKMFSYIGHEVLKLKRVKVGDIEIGNLDEGQWRFMTSDEISYLKGL